MYQQSTDYTVKEFQGELRNSEYIDSLKELNARQAYPGFLHQWPWLAAVSQALRPGKVTFYLVYREDQLVALIPLEKVSRGLWPARVCSLQFPDDTNIYLNDFLVDKNCEQEPLLDAVLEHISKSGFAWDFCRLRKFTSKSQTYRSIGDSSPLREIGSSTWIPCRDETDLSKVSRKMWKNTSRLGRKAEQEIGPITLLQSDPGSTQEAFFGHFLEVESSGWKGASGTGTSIANDKLAQGFFRQLFQEYASEWRARVFVLKFGTQTVASTLAVFTDSTWNLLKIGYDEEFRKFGPGGILVQSFLQEMSDDESVEAVSLTTSPAWAERWHFNQMPVYETMIFSRGIRGKISKTYFKLRSKLSAWKRVLENRRQGKTV